MTGLPRVKIESGCADFGARGMEKDRRRNRGKIEKEGRREEKRKKRRKER